MWREESFAGAATAGRRRQLYSPSAGHPSPLAPAAQAVQSTSQPVSASQAEGAIEPENRAPPRILPPRTPPNSPRFPGALYNQFNSPTRTPSLSIILFQAPIFSRTWRVTVVSTPFVPRRTRGNPGIPRICATQHGTGD